jgi:hypothetical protein
VTVVKVASGVCGFTTRIQAKKVEKRTVSIELESDCPNMAALSEALKQLGALTMREILNKNEEGNPVFRVCSEHLAHSSCPVRVAILKAAEVELGLALPRPATIEFES